MDNKHLVYFSGNPRIVLTEWVPTGVHFIYTLQKKLTYQQPSDIVDITASGSLLPPGAANFYITSEVDHEPNAAIIDLGKSEVRVRVLKYQHMESIRLESQVDIVDTGSEYQDENIGIEISHDGRVSYGITLAGSYCLDDAAHVVADLIEDTSRVMNTLLNSYQRRLLDVVFCNESRHRDKHLVLIADGLQTEDGRFLNYKDFFTNRDYGAELSQLLGQLDLSHAHAISETEYIIPGENGILMVGKENPSIDNILLACSIMNTAEIFIANVLKRVSWSWDCLNEQEWRIRNQDSAAIMDIQTQLSELSAEQVLLLSVPAQLRFGHMSIL